MQHETKNTTRNVIATISIALMFAFTAPALRAEDKPAPKPDAKEPANDASLDDLLKLPTNPNDVRKPDVTKKPIDDSRGLSPGDAADRFVKAVAEMKDAAERLVKQKDAGIETQRIQESVLRKLDDVIAAAQQQRQQKQQQQQQGQKQENGSQKNEQKSKQPGDPQQQQGNQQQSQQATDQSQKGNAPDAKAGGPIEENRIEWGRLPARIRGELEQGLGEKFSPLYKKLTEAYYRRLAEEGKE